MQCSFLIDTTSYLSSASIMFYCLATKGGLETQRPINFHSQLISWYKSNPETIIQKTISFYRCRYKCVSIVESHVMCGERLLAISVKFAAVPLVLFSMVGSKVGDNQPIQLARNKDFTCTRCKLIDQQTSQDIRCDLFPVSHALHQHGILFTGFVGHTAWSSGSRVSSFVRRTKMWALHHNLWPSWWGERHFFFLVGWEGGRSPFPIWAMDLRKGPDGP